MSPINTVTTKYLIKLTRTPSRTYSVRLALFYRLNRSDEKMHTCFPTLFIFVYLLTSFLIRLEVVYRLYRFMVILIFFSEKGTASAIDDTNFMVDNREKL